MAVTGTFVAAGLIYNQYRQDQIQGQQVEQQKEAYEAQVSDMENDIAEAEDRLNTTTGDDSFRSAKAAQDRRRRQVAGMFGRSDTIATSPLGATGNAADGGRKTLLGA